jgi:hypothetical protein
MIVCLIPLPDIVEASRSDSTNPVPFRVHVESPASILAFDYFRRGYSENSNTDRDLINSAKEFELDKVVGSIVHIDPVNNRLRNSRSGTFTNYNRTSKLIYLFDNRLLLFIASIMTCVARVPRLSMQ